MLEKLNIKNFRCFDEILIDNIKQVNLITGKNNAGKTALLEAIYNVLNSNNILANTIELRGLADQRFDDIKLFRDITFQQNGNPVKIDFLAVAGSEATVRSYTFNPGSHPKIEFSSEKFISDNLGENTIKGISCIFILDRKLQLPKTGNIYDIYDSAVIDGMDNGFLTALKIIDPDIEELRTFSKYPNSLFYRKNGEKKFYLLQYLGDAANKIVTLIANIFFYFRDNNAAINALLIDEIENGLHYSVQGEFWKMLIKFSIEYNIQLFATTHSREMLEAYCAVSKEFDGAQTYFELARNYNNKIVAINHSMDLLEYELQKNEEIRG